MSDIVERLRRGVLTHQERRSTELEAADEIERLRAEVEWFRVAQRQKYEGMETLGTMDGFHNGPSK